MLQRIIEYVDFKETLYKSLNIPDYYQYLHINIINSKFQIEHSYEFDSENESDYNIYFEDYFGGSDVILDMIIKFDAFYLIKIEDVDELWILPKENEF